MEKEAGLLPTWLRLQQTTLLSAARLKSLSNHHPMQKWLHNASLTRTAVIPHRSILGNLLNQFEILTEETEHIEPFIKPPWWIPKFTVQIAATKELAKVSHNEIQATSNSDTMHIYTDGSNIDKKVGAAAYNATSLATSRQHLGSETSFNVFTAEVEAVNLALKQWQYDSHGLHPICHLYSDSQAGCTAILQPMRQSGQSIIKGVLDRIDMIHRRHPDWQLTISWIPGHQDIDGNECADAAAKQAARTPPSTHRDRYPHNRLKSSLQQAISSIIKTKWNHHWSQNKSASHLRRILIKSGNKPGPKLYNNITTRASCAILVQLRTGHCGLNKHLHRLKLVNSAYCACGYGKETVEHFLLECRRYKEERKQLRKSAGWRMMKMEKLLGNTKAIKHTIEFVKSTGRFIT
jgi:ribonuclease HI